jgi:hypothetical protein
MKNLTINGDVGFVGTAYSSGGNATVNGNVYYGGASFNASNINVTGTITQTNVSPPTIDYTSLQNQAGIVYSSSQNNRTFDFTAAGGTNPVIFVNGDVSNPTFIGSGTLVVTGSITYSGSIGSATNPVNLVAEQNVSNTGGSMTLYGSIYAGGNWTHSASFNITGIVCITGTDNSGNLANGMIRSTAAPWFDTRKLGGSIGLKVTNFSGITP